MECFNDLFNKEPLWSVEISNDQILPDGIYAFLEFYCGNYECDCKNGLFHFVESDLNGDIHGNPIALIDYSWKKDISEENPSLDEPMPSKLTLAALRIFSSEIRNQDRVDIIKTHYKMLKEHCKDWPVQSMSDPDFDEDSIKIGRNEPCPCGSSKKYKRCCGTK